jgi:hypothetical protein
VLVGDLVSCVVLVPNKPCTAELEDVTDTVMANWRYL